jgi:hypothetical protein
VRYLVKYPGHNADDLPWFEHVVLEDPEDVLDRQGRVQVQPGQLSGSRRRPFWRPPHSGASRRGRVGRRLGRGGHCLGWQRWRHMVEHPESTAPGPSFGTMRFILWLRASSGTSYLSPRTLGSETPRTSRLPRLLASTDVYMASGIYFLGQGEAALMSRGKKNRRLIPELVLSCARTRSTEHRQSRGHAVLCPLMSLLTPY